MKVLVTGATGFLGSWVTRELVRAGHDVRVLARDRSRLGELGELVSDVVIGDILSRECVARSAVGADAIVHCAGLVSLSLRDREAMQQVNLEGSRNVLETAARSGIRAVHTSTIATVGPTPDPRPLQETDPVVPLTFDYPYAQTKRDAEDLAFELCGRGADIVVVNPGILFGPGDVHFTSTQFVLRYLRGELWMHLAGGASFADVRDVAAASVVALNRGRRGERYLLAGVNRTYRDLQEELRLLTGLQRSAPLPRPMADWFAMWSQATSAVWSHPFEEFNPSVVKWASMFNYCSSAKAAAQLGYESRDFAETLADTIVDHLRRGAARPRTMELEALLARA